MITIKPCFIVVFILFMMQRVSSNLLNDTITNLPGLNFKPNFKQYSGYLNASNGTYFHYWFLESQSSPSSDPILLWLNGGPGCSSLIGLLTENGPFRLSGDSKTIVENPYSWNKLANVLYMESPSMVGFSYSTDPNETDWTDTKTGVFNKNALYDFFKNVAPQYQSNPFYITGESYGGMYVPIVAALIAKDSTFPANFSGVAIGNGLLSWALNSQSYFEILYYHGIYSSRQLNKIQNFCCNGTALVLCDISTVYSAVRGFNASTSNQCRNALTAADNNTAALDAYNLYYSCYTPSNVDLPILDVNLRQHQTVLDAYAKVHPKGSSAQVCRSPLDDTTANYLNQPQVRAALHIRTSQNWSSCNMYVNEVFGIEFNDMSAQIMTLIAAKKKVLIYNGDVDTACNFLGDEWFTENLNLTSSGSYQPWTYRFDFVKVAGYIQRYQEGLDFMTIRGSGHFVPQTHPRECLQMIANFLWNKDYSTPTNINVVHSPMIASSTVSVNRASSFISLVSLLSLISSYLPLHGFKVFLKCTVYM